MLTYCHLTFRKQTSVKFEFRFQETPKKPVQEPVEEPKDEPDAAAPAQTAPEFTSAPQPVAIKEGETLKLSCKLKGTSNVNIILF